MAHPDEEASLERMRVHTRAAYSDVHVRFHPDLSRATRKLWLLVSMRVIPMRFEEDLMKSLARLVAAALPPTTQDAVDDACQRAENLLSAVHLAVASPSSDDGRAA